MKLSILACFILSVSSLMAGPPAPKKEGIEGKNYVWNAQDGEKIEALKLKGDVVRGKDAYEVCAACHLPSGAGRPDGTFPQLAGQHATVIIKQISDIREGLRDNPTMYPFAKTLTDAQELADVSAYIQTLKIPHNNGKGSDDPKVIAQGKDLYEKHCTTCHMQNGEGNEEKFYPVLAGQHYKYMLRQITDIKEGRRRNANPDMVKIVKDFKTSELEAVVSYMANLKMPERSAPETPSKPEKKSGESKKSKKKS